MNDGFVEDLECPARDSGQCILEKDGWLVEVGF